MRLQIEQDVWHNAKKFRDFHKKFLDNRPRLGKLPRLVVDTKDERYEYGPCRLGDLINTLFTDSFEFAMRDMKMNGNLNEQLCQNLYIAVLRYVKKEMLVSDADAFERITRILHEVSKIKPSDGMPALYHAYSRALLKV